MTRPKSKFTNEEKVLIHLHDFQRFREAAEAPLQVTQEGMSNVIGITQSHVSYALKSLKREGDLEDAGLSHIKGKKRRRKAYFLSDGGYKRSKELHKALDKTDVNIIDVSGSVQRIGLRTAQKVTGLSLFELMEMMEDGETIDLGGLQTKLETEELPEEERDHLDVVIDTLSAFLEIGVSSTAKAVKEGVEIAERVGRDSIAMGKKAAKKTVKKTKKATERILEKLR